MRVSEALDRYVVQLEADGRSSHTVNQAKRHVRLLIASMGDRDVATIKPEDVAKFLASDAVTKTDGGGARRPSSANALRSSMRTFFAFVHASGYAPVNAARLVRRAHCGPSRPRAISDADAGKLLARLALAQDERGKRDRVMVEVMLRAGIRVGSLVALDVEDLHGDELRLRNPKGGGEALAYIPREIAELVRAYVGERSTGPLFVGSSGHRLTTRHVARRLAGWAQRAGIGSTHPHALRHSFGQRVFDRTGDVLTTAAALTHRSLASTAIYARAKPSAVRAAVTR